MIHGNGIVGIGFSLFVVAIAALNLVLDFDFIETGVERGAPKYMEWYGAFGLMITLVWLYIEFLRLLSKLPSRLRRGLRQRKRRFGPFFFRRCALGDRQSG